jgi:hypothetical protein
MGKNKILYLGLILCLLCGCGSVKGITDTKSVSDATKAEETGNKIVIDESNQKIETSETVDDLEGNEHEMSHINIREDIINTDEVKKQGGDIEFADNMTYKEFLDLHWVNDVDESLPNDTKVYIVKIYYPNGYEHYKIGLINKCEAIGIYRAEDGEYLGGSFKERSK